MLFPALRFIYFTGCEIDGYCNHRLIPFCSPLLGESLLLYFPLATKMFPFGFALACL
jgi:hypothetical protein